MHLTNMFRQQNRIYLQFSVPSSSEGRTFQGDIERVERMSSDWSDRKACSRRELGSLEQAP